MAGAFYPAEPQALRRDLALSLGPLLSPTPAKGVILPHAGYVYSGRTAGGVLRRVQVPDTCFLVGPNHRGHGESFALSDAQAWETPLGRVAVDRDFTNGILIASHDLREDSLAHAEEHSLEVVVPFLQYRNPGVCIIPLLIGTLDLEQAREVGLSLVEYLRSQSRFLIVASTDMTHYESDEATRKKDAYALRAIEALDEEALAAAVKRHRITMCGFVPVYLSLILWKALGAQKATLVDYRTSAEASGDYDRVVGYAGFVVN